jgi:hypothetical protein
MNNLLSKYLVVIASDVSDRDGIGIEVYFHGNTSAPSICCEDRECAAVY